MRILATVDARLLPIERDISTIKLTVLDIHEDLDVSLRATDNHAEQLIDHTKRIRRLEKRAA